ncbi:MAG: SMP-30/gluconolactonase/LRE family protein [Halobacteriaceae archaeon]
MDVTRAADYGTETGEGVLWHPDEEVVYWLDIPNGRIFRYDPETGDHERVHEDDRRIGGFTIQADGDLLLFMDDGEVQLWNEEDGLGDVILSGIPEEEGSRFNDVIAGPEGRVYAGTMAEGGSRGRLYRFETDGTFDVLIEGVATANGMGFSPDNNRFYFTETNAETVWAFDFVRETGDLRNRRPFVTTVGGPGKPDGLTVDEDGYVWSARWNGHSVVRFAPDGSEDARVRFPARKVASVAFGGEDYGTAFAPTATAGYSRDVEGEGAGALFSFTPAVNGLPEFRSRIEF